MRSVQLAAVCLAALAAATAASAQTAGPPAPTGAQSQAPSQIPESTAPQATPAPSTPAPDLTVAFNFGVSNDYRFRGVSQTDRDPQGFAGVDVTYKSMFYVGAWTSNLDFRPFGDDSTTEEVDVYGGVRPTYAGFSFDLGYQYYGYINQPKYLPHVDYGEVYGKVTKAFGKFTPGLSVYYSPEFTGGTGEAVYSEGNLAYTINPKWSASGAVGHQYIENGLDYTTWNLGLTYALTDKLSVDVRYYDTDHHGAGDPYKANGVVTLKATF